MTENELISNMKKMVIVIILAIIIIILVLVKIVFGSKKAELSMYTSTDNFNSVDLQALELNEDEIEKYLSIFGNLIDDKATENQKKLNLATNYIENMYSSYETQTNSEDKKIFDADIINGTLKEITGENMESTVDMTGMYTFDSSQNVYIQNSNLNRIPICIKINNVSKNENEFTIEYTLAIMTAEQMAEYSTGKEVDYESKEVKIVLTENEEYQYSKYKIKNIE